MESELILGNNLESFEAVEDVDVWGFDADHTLVGYDVIALTEMIDEAYEKTIYKDCKGYPPEFKTTHYTNADHPDYLGMCLNGVVFDFTNFRLLKISNDNRVMRGYHGFEEMSEADIKEIYGEGRKFDFDVTQYRKYPEYAAYHTYFDCPIILMLAKILDLHRGGLISKSGEEIYDDIRSVIMMNYVHYTPDKMHDIKEFGHFFPVISKNPNHYILRRDDFREMLINLRKKGKKLFLSTNSHVDYCDLIMGASLGDDWMELFDFVGVASMKPFLW